MLKVRENLRKEVAGVAHLAERKEMDIESKSRYHSLNGAKPDCQMRANKLNFRMGNFLGKICFALLTAVFIFSGCKKENGNGEGKEDDNGTSIIPSDPAGTITADIGAASWLGYPPYQSGTFISFFDEIDTTYLVWDLAWGEPNNFVYASRVHMVGTWDVAISVCDLGEKKGLGDIQTIPSDGYSGQGTSNTIACNVGHGYVFRIENLSGNQPSGVIRYYARLYVVESIMTSDSIIGAKVKYQYPFKP